MTNGGGHTVYEEKRVERKEPKPRARKGSGRQVKRPKARK
jgi:hypothetical protein